MSEKPRRVWDHLAGNMRSLPIALAGAAIEGGWDWAGAKGDETMKALSIQQPYAWLIANGHKDIENRSWPTNYRGWVLIHAGKRFKKEFDGEIDLPSEYDAGLPDYFDMGGIVGKAEIVGCVSESRSPWFHGRFGFLIRNARPLPFRPCLGRLGFFEPDFTPSPAPHAPPKPAQSRPRCDGARVGFEPTFTRPGRSMT